MSWAPRSRTWKRRRVKACRVCRFPYRPWSRSPVLPRATRLTGAGSRLRATAWCARRDLNPQPPGSRPGASACWATSTWSRLPVSNGSPRRYELRALPDELRRHGSGSWGRTNVDGFRGRRPAIRRSRISRRGGIRTRICARFELGRYTCSTYSPVVRRERFELPSTALRVQRSAWLSLPAHGAPPGNRTPLISLEG